MVCFTIVSYLLIASTGLRAQSFDVPDLEGARRTPPPAVVSRERRRVQGVVLATWHNNHALIRTPSGKFVTLKCLPSALPKYRDSIEAVGYPDTNSLQTNMTHCLWRPCAPLANAQETAPQATTVSQLLIDENGRPRINHGLHGKRVRLSGRINGFPSFTSSDVRFVLSDEITNVPFYIHNFRIIALEHNSIVEITGTCVVETEHWNPFDDVPTVREVLIYVDSSDDIRILKGPPWWTTGKLIGAIVCLLLVICGFFVWNLSLKRMLSRRSRALEREISARLASNLKTRERTRLAVELHDSISQNLSGMAMEIGTAIRVARSGIDGMLPHLSIASRTLQSCRDDLRDCLWDLRSNALEESVMNDAIHTTLRPYLRPDTVVHVRFNVPRKLLSDNTAHTLLRIVRELVSNAIRHGGASEIKIAGTIDDRKLLFSVQDNGCGFDPSSSPGITEGHFGLQGIRERIERFDGTLKFDRVQPNGAKATISMCISFPQEEDDITP